MKITLLGSKNYDSLEFHLNESLTYLSHIVTHIDIKDVVNVPYRFNYYATKLLPKYDDYVFKKLAKKVIESSPDLVVCTYRFIHPNCIKDVKSALPSVKVIHINPDALTNFEYQQIFVSPYDAYFTKDPYIVDFMRNKMSLNAFYFPEAFNPRVHQSPERNRLELETEINIDVVAFGTMYPYRSKMLKEVVDAGLSLTVFGTPDKRFPLKEISNTFRNEFITGKRKAEVLLGSKIVFNNFHYGEIESANLKFFEINGIGGFQICDYKPVLSEYSTIPLEKFTYKTIGEAIDLLKYYLNHQKERHEIAEEQRIHFEKYHTYDNRLKQLLDKL